MALDFSKFVLPTPSAEWLSKVPEYSAAGAKQQAAADKQSQAFDKMLQNTLYGKPLTVKDPEAIIDAEIKNKVDAGVPEIYTWAKSQQELGRPSWEIMNEVQQKMASLNKDANQISGLGTIYKKGVEEPYSKFKGFKKANARKNFVDVTQYTTDESGNKIPSDIATVIKNTGGDPTAVAAKVIDPNIAPNDIWGDEDIIDVLSKAKPIKSKETFRYRNASGVETGKDVETVLPSSFYDFQQNEQGEDVPVPKGEEITIADDNIAKAYQDVLGEAVSGNKINIVPEETFNALKNEGGDYYLKQEQAKFEKAARKNGVVTRDANGQLTPEFTKELNNFSKAMVYKTVDRYLPQAGYSTSIGKVNKKPLPISPSTQGKKTSNIEDEKATLATYNDKWTNQKDADGFIDIKDEVSGINDPDGREYRKKAAVKLGKANGKWIVKVYKKDDNGNPVLERTMDLDKFRADSKTGSDSDEKRQAAHSYIKKWTQIIDKESAPKSGGRRSLNATIIKNKKS